MVSVYQFTDGEESPSDIDTNWETMRLKKPTALVAKLPGNALGLSG